MTNDLAIRAPDFAAIEAVLIGGDLKALSAEQRLQYSNGVCESLGLNRLTQPFLYITLNGKLVLYATKSCTEQLRKIHGVAIEDVSGREVNGVYVVTAKGRDAAGRTDCSTGAVTIDGLRGDNLANALMKAETKAKRRLTLSICGLGMLDESELETIPGATRDPSLPPPSTVRDVPKDKVSVTAAMAATSTANGTPRVVTKQELVGLIATWSGCSPEMQLESTKLYLDSKGIKGKLSDKQRIDLYDEVERNMEAGVEFADVIAPKEPVAAAAEETEF